jgi:hypothetical protein
MGIPERIGKSQLFKNWNFLFGSGYAGLGYDL